MIACEHGQSSRACYICELEQKVASLTQTSAELCNTCGWRMQFPGEECCKCGHERLKAELEDNNKHRHELQEANKNLKSQLSEAKAEIDRLKPELEVEKQQHNLRLEMYLSTENQLAETKRENCDLWAVINGIGLGEYSEYKSKYYNLLAVIHRDGGHYLAKHSEEKASEDGIQKVLEAYQEMGEIDQRKQGIVAEGTYYSASMLGGRIMIDGLEDVLTDGQRVRVLVMKEIDSSKHWLKHYQERTSKSEQQLKQAHRAGWEQAKAEAKMLSFSCACHKAIANMEYREEV